MKTRNLIIILPLLLGIGLFESCNKEKHSSYSVFNIYFDYLPSNYLTGQVDVTFAFTPETVVDSIYKIVLKVTGKASAFDRIFNVKVDLVSTAIAGRDYVLPDKFVFRAYRYIDTLPVTVLRTPGQKTKAETLILNLEPSTDFHTNIKMTNEGVNATAIKLMISDMLIKDTNWESSYSEYFGTFSEKKVRLISTITGMELIYIKTGTIDIFFKERMNIWAIKMANYLKDQKAAGNTIYEDDGITPIAMSANYP